MMNSLGPALVVPPCHQNTVKFNSHSVVWVKRLKFLLLSVATGALVLWHSPQLSELDTSTRKTARPTSTTKADDPSKAPRSVLTTASLEEESDEKKRGKKIKKKEKKRKKHHSFDYQSFWQNAWKIALENNQTLTNSGAWREPGTHGAGPISCPKVYVYNLSEDFQDETEHHLASRDRVFGPPEPTWDDGGVTSLRQINQFHAAAILYHRLQQPDNCYRTHDPSQADLFFVPLFLRSKNVQQWSKRCQSLNVSRMITEELTHLTSETACQHFFLLSKGTFAGKSCLGWFRDPHPLLQNAMRLAYSHDPDAPQRDAHLFSVPYPSNLHYDHATAARTAAARSPPWQQHDNRTILMSYVGRFDHGDVKVRQRIQEQCQRYYDQETRSSPPICHIPAFTSHNETTKRSSTIPSLQILVKAQSTFCLEPAGDSPWRKSLSDSLSFGCIPVLFSNLTDQVAPWHWGLWKQQARVLVDRTAFVEGAIDLHTLLRSIPPPLLTLMQQTISRFARQFQYSLSDDPGMDGVHATLQGLTDHMKESKRQGLCSR